ncbi:MAG TPA: 23S rRNA (adenine(2030)-N(6))-methyltransferase RlmJ [Pseudorhodoplanes sp.]|nr:23S rRNA (adenine(2030)-N(6))-methyltransferase RlmJ [Pseudorhodoplanes sp.]
MNYRHAFHAGNFADVVKHAVLTRILLHLLKKDTPFRVIDTHAGAAIYDLASEEATRGGEWKDGIGRVIEATFDPAAAALIAPYLDAVRAVNPQGRLRRYPGSPSLIGSFLRPGDRLIACEIEPKAAGALIRHLGRDRRLKAIAIDGWTALAAYIPPKERRGLVLIDPPFEERNEFDRLAQALAAACRKWPEGLYLAWYPIKDARDTASFVRALSRSGIARILRIELTLANPGAEGLRGSGLIAVNPPWTLESELQSLLPALARVLVPGRRGGVLLQWLAGRDR